MKNLKKGIWLYFILLIIEGGLRRWLLPSLANPLLIIRDPLALYLLFNAIRLNVFPKNKLIPIIFCIGVISIFTALFFGHGNLFVALFGARILLIQFPMLFLIGRIFDRNDVVHMGKVILWISIPMALLITLQFYSPQTAWLNKGVGDSLEGAGFQGTEEYFRPPGTFSFISGVSAFFGLTACFIFYFWLQPRYVNKKILILSTIALIIAIPTSISRTLFFEVVISLFFFIWAKKELSGFFKSTAQLLSMIFLLIVLAISTDKLNTQIGVFTERFTSANEEEGGIDGVIVDRFLGGMTLAIVDIDDKHVLFGQGIGMGTNVGAQLLTGKTTFLIAEAEWGRIIGESGILLGLSFILIRIKMSFNFLFLGLKHLKKGDPLPWMLTSFGFLTLMQSQLAQPNNLGFFVLIGGLILASLKQPKYRIIK